MMTRKQKEYVRKKAGFWKWFFRILLLLLVLVVVTFIILYFTGFFHNLLRQILITELSKYTKSEVALGGLRGDLFSTIEVDDVAFGNQGSLADGVSISVHHARVRWSPLALLSGRVKIDGIYAEDGYCHIVQNPGHADLNVAEMFVSPPGPAPMTDIEAIRLRNGRVDLSIPGVPFHQMDIDETQVEVHSSGRVTRVIVNSLKARLPQLNLPVESFSGTLEYHEKVNSDYTPYISWTILDKLDMVTPKSHLCMSARIDNIPKLQGEYNANGSIISLDEFAPILENSPKLTGIVNVEQSKISVTDNDWKISADTSCIQGMVDNYAIDSLDASWELHNDVLIINRLTAKVAEGTISNAYAKITFTKVPQYNITAAFEALNLTKLLPEVPDTVLNGEVAVTGIGISPSDRDLTVKAALLPSTIASVNLDHLTLDASVVGETVNVTDVIAGRGAGTLSASGVLSPQNVKFSLDMQNIALSDISFFTGTSGVEGSFSLQGDLTGTFNNLNLAGNLVGSNFRYNSYSIGKLIANIDMNMTPQLRGRGRIEAENGLIAKIPIENISADIEILPSGIELQSLNVVGADGELQADLLWDFGTKQQIIVHDLALQYRAMRALCPAGFTLTQESDGLELSSASFDLVGINRKSLQNSHIPGLEVATESNSTLEMGNFTIEGKLSYDGASDIQASLSEFPFEGVDSIFTQSAMLSGKVDKLTLHYFGTISQPNFDLDATLSNGPIAELPGSGHIRFAYNGGVLQLEDLNYVAGGGRLTGHGSLALNATVATPIVYEPLRITMEGIDLRIFQKLTDIVLFQEGNLTGDVLISGDLLHPQLEGKVHIADARFLLGELYNYISDFSGDVFFLKDHIVFGRTIAQMESSSPEVTPLQGLLDGKPMQLEGEIQIPELIPSNYNLHLYAGGMNFRGLPGSQLKVAVDVTLQGEPERLKLSGKVKVLSGLMNIPFGSNDPEQEPELATGVELPFDMDIVVGADRGIWLRNNEADFELAANVRVEYGRGILSLSGELNTVRGIYHFVGRDFNISEGKLLFLGTPTFDPALNIEGVTEVSDETSATGRMPIYIHVTGTLTHPEISLSSSDHPNLTQNDLIQLLALNISYNDYLALQGTTNQTSFSSIFTQQGTQYVLGQISGVLRRATSLDTIETSFPTSAEENIVQQLGQTQITIGKYLTQNIYLSYTSQLYQTSGMRRIDLEYFLGGGFSILGMANERASERAAGLSLKYIYRY